jgi:hypothetical protein
MCAGVLSFVRDRTSMQTAGATRQFRVIAMRYCGGLMQRPGADCPAEIHVAGTPIVKGHLHTGGEEGVFIHSGSEFMRQ